MAKSIEKTDIYGDKYTVNYDDDGNKISESRTKTDIYGDSYVQHVNMDGDKIGESRARTDIYGDSYVQHVDSDSEKIGESWTKTDVYGDRYVQHLDDEGDKVGESRTKTDIYGDRYVKHTGDVPYQQDRQTQAANSSSSTSESSDSFSSSGGYSDSSSDYSSSEGSSESSGSGPLWIVAIAIGVVFLIMLGGGQRPEPTPPQSEAPPKLITGWAPPNTYYYSDGTSFMAGAPPSNTNPPATPPVYLFQNTLPGTYNMGQDRSQIDPDRARRDACSPRLSWEFLAICRSQELTALNRRVLRLQSIYDMAEDGHAQSFEDMRWQNKVTTVCENDPSPEGCLHSHLEERSQWLQEKIVEALASPRPTLFKDSARKLWEKHDW